MALVKAGTVAAEGEEEGMKAAGMEGRWEEMVEGREWDRASERDSSCGHGYSGMERRECQREN